MARYLTGDTVPITGTFTDSSGGYVTGLTPTIDLWRKSDGQFWTGTVYQATNPNLTMSEVSAGNQPGRYKYDFVTTNADEEEHGFLLADSTAVNGPLGGELIVGGEWDNMTNLDAPVSVVDTVVDGIAVTVALLPYNTGEVVAVSYDSSLGSAGTVVGVNGTVDNPVDTLADAVTLAAALGIRAYSIKGSLLLTSTHVNWQFYGAAETLGCTVNGGGQIVGGSRFVNASLAGTFIPTGGTGTGMVMEDCNLSFVSGMRGTARRCGLHGTTTLAAAGESIFYDCYSRVSGATAPKINLAAVGATTMLRGYSGGIQLDGVSAALAADISVEFTAGQLLVDGTGGGVVARGVVGPITDLSGGAVSITTLGAVSQDLISDAVWDEASAGHATAGSTGLLLTSIGEALVGRIEIDVTTTPWRENHYDLATQTSIVRAFELFDRSGVAISGNEASGNNPLANADVLVARKVLV